MKNYNKRNIYQEVTDTIIKQLGEVSAEDYRSPWVNILGQSPMSIDGRAYRGLNWVLLSNYAAQCPSMTFGTYNAWKNHGGHVRKGERGKLVTLWKSFKVTNGDGDGDGDGDNDGGASKTGLFLRHFTVFGAEQVDNIDVDSLLAKRRAKQPNKAQALAHVESLVANYLTNDGLTLAHGGNRAFYAPSKDHIQMPERASFYDTEGYYSTLLHEMGHSTLHAKRLDRKSNSRRFGDIGYAQEELVAEITSAMLTAALGIEDQPRPDHARYLQSWLQCLKDHNKAIFTAASQAQKAADYIMAYAADSEVRAAA
ncbi:antirestriction protein [uncultured Mediterranean phage]|nr:antirestriction protein [uncultured Mediterranean phage]